ncbi:unnamed protein product [Urochloa humidicola]
MASTSTYAPLNRTSRLCKSGDGRRVHPPLAAPGRGGYAKSWDGYRRERTSSAPALLGPSATEVLARPPVRLCHPSLPRAAVPGCLQAAEEVPPPGAGERSRGSHGILDQAGRLLLGRGELRPRWGVVVVTAMYHGVREDVSCF